MKKKFKMALLMMLVLCFGWGLFAFIANGGNLDMSWWHPEARVIFAIFASASIVIVTIVTFNCVRDWE